MNTVPSLEFQKNMADYRRYAFNKHVFVYPTDTMYGIGSIISAETIQKIEQIKPCSTTKQYSIIAPSFDRIRMYFEVDPLIDQQWAVWTERYGPITVLLPLKSIYDFSLISNTDIIGVRMLSHRFQSYVKSLGQPFVITAMNTAPDIPLRAPADIPQQDADLIDLCIDEGSLEVRTTTIIDYSTAHVITRDTTVV